MTELVFCNKAITEPFTTSNVIAEHAGVKHHAIQQLLTKYQNDFEEFGVFAFEMRKPESGGKGGRPEIIYQLNEQQATLLLTYLKNTQQVRAFKKELVRQFYAMREYIREHQSPHWQQTRLESKINRRMETDTIKDFVAYATAQGSKHADRYYCLFSKLANEAVGIQSKQRDRVTATQLNSLILIESILANTIQLCMTQSTPYKDVYKTCKARLGDFRKMVQLEFVAIPALQAVASSRT